jgi:hypothetical protein
MDAQREQVALIQRTLEQCINFLAGRSNCDAMLCHFVKDITYTAQHSTGPRKGHASSQ